MNKSMNKRKNNNNKFDKFPENELNQYQRFNIFPMTWKLSRKDNLYNDLATEKIKYLDLNDIKHLVSKTCSFIKR